MAGPERPSPPLERGAVPWLLAATLASAAPHAIHLPPWISALGAVLLLWRAWIWQQDKALPPRWLLALPVLGAIVAISGEYRAFFGRDAGVAVLFLLMAAKSLEMQTRRDAIALVMLGHFLLLTLFFYAQTLLVGAWMVATATLLSAVLIRVHGGAQPPAAIAGLAARLSLQALPLALLLFVIFPRVSGPLWGLPQDAFTAGVGLSERMSPGSFSSLIQSGAIALRVRFAGEVPKQDERYFRGPVFENYDGRSWTMNPEPERANRAHIEVPAGGRTIDYETTLEAHNQRWLLALDMPVVLPPDAVLGETFAALARDPVRQRTRFAFTSAPDFVANREESGRVLLRSLLLPGKLNPRARALAAGWVAESGGQAPEQVVERALALFGEEPFAYTLQPPLLGRDAVDDFLFSSRRGFCEHYASAFVFLMRAAGIPARVVGGYQGGEINPVDGYLVLRQSDAHAWAEVWIRGRGWLRVDPTAAVAPSRIERGIAAALPVGEALPLALRIDAPWLRALRDRWEATNNAWNQWVLGYSPERQRSTFARLGLGEVNWRPLAIALSATAGLVLLALAATAFLRQRPRDPAERAWQRFCRRLAAHGVVRAGWEGPLAFAERVARERPQLARLTRDAAGHYALLRYGKGTPEDLQQLRQCVRRASRVHKRSMMNEDEA